MEKTELHVDATCFLRKTYKIPSDVDKLSQLAYKCDMNTIILYATKYGATRQIAERLAEKMGGAIMHDLRQGDAPSLDSFEFVILGSATYAGSIRKEAKTYLSRNACSLLEKKLGLFLCGLEEEKAKENIKTNFPQELLQAARAVSLLGGVFDPNKASAPERFMMKLAKKHEGYWNTIDDSRIESFVKNMKAV